MATTPKYNITVIGAPGVGKSALTLRLLYEEFVDDYEPTKLDSYSSTIDYQGSRVDVCITDTAGQEDYASIRDTYLRNGEGFLCVFSLTETESYHHVKDLYRQVKAAKNMEPPQLPFLLVGNKCDLESLRQIDRTEADSLAASLDVDYMETSAKTNHNVTEAFQQLIGLIAKSRPVQTIEEAKKKKRKKKSKFFCGLL